jgi:single-strand DNA-binding protein
VKEIDKEVHMAGRGLNKVQLIGNLGRDPEVKFLQSGQAVANFTLATSRSWEKDGQKVEETEWHKIVMYGKLAEIAGQWLGKGKQVYLEGRIKTRNYDKDGQKHYVTEIIADQMIMLGGGGKGGEGGGGGEAQPEPSYSGSQTPPDDIPF